jgi:hypothetical protein
LHVQNPKVIAKISSIVGAIRQQCKWNLLFEGHTVKGKSAPATGLEFNHNHHEVEQRSQPSLPSPRRRAPEHSGMRYELHKFSFAALRIGGSTYGQDVVIDRGEIRKRKEAPSGRFRDEFGHTPLSIEEKIPWKCHRLVIGTGAYGRLPVVEEVKLEAERRHVELVIVPTSEAIRLMERSPRQTGTRRNGRSRHFDLSHRAITPGTSPILPSPVVSEAPFTGIKCICVFRKDSQGRVVPRIAA